LIAQADFLWFTLYRSSQRQDFTLAQREQEICATIHRAQYIGRRRDIGNRELPGPSGRQSALAHRTRGTARQPRSTDEQPGRRMWRPRRGNDDADQSRCSGRSPFVGVVAVQRSVDDGPRLQRASRSDSGIAHRSVPAGLQSRRRLGVSWSWASTATSAVGVVDRPRPAVTVSDERPTVGTRLPSRPTCSRLPRLDRNAETVPSQVPTLEKNCHIRNRFR